MFSLEPAQIPPTQTI
uniref:Uncharacterized protein n=1 Tax=Rhizophora mucronata TaxID=61149 RepID=A0A2P2NPL7_RHIMU